MPFTELRLNARPVESPTLPTASAVKLAIVMLVAGSYVLSSNAFSRYSVEPLSRISDAENPTRGSLKLVMLATVLSSISTIISAYPSIPSSGSSTTTSYICELPERTSASDGSSVRLTSPVPGSCAAAGLATTASSPTNSSVRSTESIALSCIVLLSVRFQL